MNIGVSIGHEEVDCVCHTASLETEGLDGYSDRRALLQSVTLSKLITTDDVSFSNVTQTITKNKVLNKSYLETSEIKN